MKEWQYPQWQRKDGSFIRMVDMNDHHLINAIKLCERLAEFKMKNYFLRITSDAEEFTPTDEQLVPNLRLLRAEATRRGMAYIECPLSTSTNAADANSVTKTQ